MTALSTLGLSVRPRLFKSWIALSTEEITIQWIRITEINYAIRWIVIYAVDSAIQRLNNQGQMMTFSRYRRKIKTLRVHLFHPRPFV